ncbi:MAG: branched-chain amino acid transport system substrate-binding protein [Myxococcota bacterium]|jgi:branched-chain amino acid transport system substrate-binding protein
MLFLLLGCSLGRFEYDTCTSNIECREAFGWGQVCGEEGLCETTEVPARCTQTWPDDLLTSPEDYADNIVLGVNYDRTNFAYEVLAMRLAIIQANEQGGLDGQDFALIECDNQASDAFDEMTQDDANTFNTEWLADSIGTPGIIGPATSGRSEAAYQVAEPLGTLLISPSATSPALTDIDGLTSTDADPGLFWRTAPPDSLQGEVIASYMINELGASVVSVVYETGPYGEGLADAFIDNFEGTGRTVVKRSYASGSERDEGIAAAGGGGFDQLLFIGSDKDDLTALFYAAGQLSAFTDEKDPVGIFLSDGAYYIDIFEEVADYDFLFDQVRGSRPTTIPGTVYDAFSASYAGAFGGQDPAEAGFTAYAYDAAWLLLYGSAWSSYQETSITGIGIGRGLRQISSGEEVDIKPSTWISVRANFEAGISIDVVGASGGLDYDPTSGETTSPIEVWGVQPDGSGGYEFTTEDIIEP